MKALDFAVTELLLADPSIRRQYARDLSIEVERRLAAGNRDPLLRQAATILRTVFVPERVDIEERR